ncbi:MAG: response regulator [Gemmatimonadetes bacterium]|nr:response regulator [Gemmatimonadota bacterium]
MQDSEAKRTVVAVVNDLMFGSRIRSAAAHAGVSSTFVRNATDLLAAAAGADLLLLDLDTRWLDAPGVIAALKKDPATASVSIVAFGPHVSADVLEAARTAGADRVLARSAFVRLLPALLQG